VLFEDEEINQLLTRICARYTSDPHLHADLMQECRLQLWRMERAQPKQTRSWYLQSCRFHLQHWLAAGRSLDTLRRTNSETRITTEDAEHPALSEYNTNGELFETICFKDTVSTLAARLGQRQRKVLNGLVDGRSLSDISSRSRISYPTVLKYRGLIADLTTKLGITSAPAQANGRAKLKEPQQN